MKTDLESFSEWLTSDAWHQCSEGWSVPAPAARFLWVAARGNLRAEMQHNATPGSIGPVMNHEQFTEWIHRPVQAPRSPPTAPDQMTVRDEMAYKMLFAMQEKRANGILEWDDMDAITDYCYSFVEAMVKRSKKVQP